MPNYYLSLNFTIPEPDSIFKTDNIRTSTPFHENIIQKEKDQGAHKNRNTFCRPLQNPEHDTKDT